MNNNQCTPVCLSDYHPLIGQLPPLPGLWLADSDTPGLFHLSPRHPVTMVMMLSRAQWTELISVIIPGPHPGSCYAVANYYLFMWRAVRLVLLCNCSCCWCMRKWGLTPGHPGHCIQNQHSFTLLKWSQLKRGVSKNTACGQNCFLKFGANSILLTHFPFHKTLSGC